MLIDLLKSLALYFHDSVLQSRQQAYDSSAYIDLNAIEKASHFLERSQTKPVMFSTASKRSCPSLSYSRGYMGTEAWLDDEIIFNYIVILAKQYNLRNDFKVAVVDPLYFSEGKLTERFSIVLSKKDNPSRDNLRSANLILCPLKKSNHWYLALIEKGIENDIWIKFLDGFNRYQQHEILRNDVEELLNIIFDDQDLLFVDYENCSYPIPKQDNSVDCGIVVCYFAMQYLKGVKLEGYSSYAEKEYNYSGFLDEIVTAAKANEKPAKKQKITLESQENIPLSPRRSVAVRA